MIEGDPRPAGDTPAGLVADVVMGLARLVQGEIALARAEVARSLSDATRAAGLLVVVAILGVTALNVLAGAAVAGLVALGLTTVWASVAVGLCLALVAVLLWRRAATLLRPSNLVPGRSLQNLQHDLEALKSTVNPVATPFHQT